MLLKGKVFSAQDPGVKIIKTNGPLSNGLLKRLHPAVPPQWTPVIRELLLPERTFRLVRDVASFYARGYEKDGPAKVRYWREHHDVVFSQAALWRFLSRLTSDTKGQFTLGITSVLLER